MGFYPQMDGRPARPLADGKPRAGGFRAFPLRQDGRGRAPGRVESTWTVQRTGGAGTPCEPFAGMSLSGASRPRPSRAPWGIRLPAAFLRPASRPRSGRTAHFSLVTRHLSLRPQGAPLCPVCLSLSSHIPSSSFRRAELSARPLEKIVPSCPSCLKHPLSKRIPSPRSGFHAFQCRKQLSEIVVIVRRFLFSSSFVSPFVPFVSQKTSQNLFPIIGKPPKNFSNHWKNRPEFSNH